MNFFFKMDFLYTNRRVLMRWWRIWKKKWGIVSFWLSFGLKTWFTIRVIWGFSCFFAFMRGFLCWIGSKCGFNDKTESFNDNLGYFEVFEQVFDFLSRLKRLRKPKTQNIEKITFITRPNFSHTNRCILTSWF